MAEQIGTTQTTDIAFAGYTAKKVNAQGNTEIWRPGYAYEGAASVCSLVITGAMTPREVGIAVAGYLGPVLTLSLEMRAQYVKMITQAPIDPEAKAIVLASLKDPLASYVPPVRS